MADGVMCSVNPVETRSKIPMRRAIAAPPFVALRQMPLLAPLASWRLNQFAYFTQHPSKPTNDTILATALENGRGG